MHFSRRFGSPVAAIAVLIGIAVLVVITVGEGLKVFVGKEDEDTELNKRDASVPWFSWSSDDPLQQRDPSPVFLANMMGAISDVAGTLVDGGVTQAMNVVGGGKNVASPQLKDAASPSIEGNTSPSAIVAVENAVNSASQDVDQIVQAATGMAGSLLASASGVSNLAPLANALATPTGNVDASEPSVSLPHYVLAAPSSEASSSSTCTTTPGAMSTGTSKPAAVNNTMPMAPHAQNGTSISPSSIKNMTMSTQNVTSESPSSTKNMTMVSAPISNNSSSAPSGVAMPSNKVQPPSPQNITSSGDSKSNSSASSGMAMPTNNIRPPPPQNMTSPKPQNNTSESPMKPSMPPLPQNNTASRPANSSCPAPMMMTMTMTTTMQSECPAPVTKTCTVTETWHSTVYADTVTMFSFMDVFTVTCTETISDCSGAPSMPTAQPSPHNSTTNSTGSYPPMGDSVDAPPPKYSGSSQAGSSSRPMPFAASRTAIASFTVNLPTGSEAMGLMATAISEVERVICSDGSMVSNAKDCLNGVVDAGPLKNRAVRGVSKVNLSKVSAVTVIHETSTTHTISPVANEKNIYSIIARHGGSRKKRDFMKE